MRLHLSSRFKVAVCVCLVVVSRLAQAQTPFSWSGFYIGGNGGGNWSDYSLASFEDVVTTRPLGLPPVNRLIPVSGFDKSDGAFIGGGQLGYNLQFGFFVIGFEGDFDGSSASTGETVFVPNGGLTAGGLTAERTLESNWSASARLRAGVAWNQLLFYATGGGAFTDVKLHTMDSFSPGAISVSSSSDRTVAGWTAGLGAEWAVTKVVSLGLEYRHSDFGKDRYDLVSTGSISPHSNSIDRSDNLVTFRVNLLLSGLLGH